MTCKFFCAAAICILTASSSVAQLKKGNRMVGASIGTFFFNGSTADLSTSIGSTTTTTDHFGVSISPSIGWFTTDYLAIGIAPSISVSSQKKVGKSSNGNTFLSDKTTDFNFGIGGFVRYYFGSSEKNLHPFGQYNLNAGLGGSKSDGYQFETFGSYVDRYDVKSTGTLFVNTGVTLGISKFINTHTALDLFLGYNFSYTKTNPKGSSVRDYSNPLTPDENQNIDYEGKFTNHGFTVGAGFQIFLEPKRK